MTCHPTTIRCTVTDRVTLHVCAPQRVQPPALIGRAVCRGASTVWASGVCVRGARAVVAGGSSVTVRGSAVRAGRAVVSGASSVEARASGIYAGRGAIVGSSSVTASAEILENPYYPIQLLSPDFFVQFKHPVYVGEQVLFRDELCTSPVTEIGNHTIGGVKNPFSGDIVLTQPSASARPLWGGESIGAVFDGIDDEFIYAGAKSDLEFFLTQANGSIFIHADSGMFDSTWVHSGRPGFYFGSRSGSSASYYNWTSTTDRELVVKDSDFYDPSHGASCSYGVTVDNGTVKFFRNKYTTTTGAVTARSGFELGHAPVFLGDGGANRFTGNVAAIGIFSRPLSQSEIDIISDAREAAL